MKNGGEKMPEFVHLHVHSQYSLLDGQASIQRIVDKAMNDGMPGIALTDHGAMYGIKEFVNYINSAKSKIKSDIKKLSKELESNPDNQKLKNEIEAKTAKLNFKPIIGCECYCARRDRFFTIRKNRRQRLAFGGACQKPDGLQKPHQNGIEKLDGRILLPSAHR